MTDPIFVIQHHLATADHYDVRFEIQGVLVSWAVPKGPSTDPRVRRLAKRTGDHDLAYADYEGVLGPRRGGGTVQVWDRGTFRNVSNRRGVPISAAEALDDGHLSVDVAGERAARWRRSPSRVSDGQPASARPAAQPLHRSTCTVTTGPGGGCNS